MRVGPWRLEGTRMYFKYLARCPVRSLLVPSSHPPYFLSSSQTTQTAKADIAERGGQCARVRTVQLKPLKMYRGFAEFFQSDANNFL